MPVQTLRLENHEYWCPWAGEDGCPNPSREQILPPSAFLFYSDLQRIGWFSHSWGQSSLFSLRFECQSLPETCSWTHPEMFYQLPEHPLTQSSQQINLTIKMEQGEHSLQFAFTFFFLYLNIFSHTQFLFKGLEFITTNPIKSDSTFWSLAHAFPYFKQY